MILNLVPNVATFRTTLRAIRLWAKSKSRHESELMSRKGNLLQRPRFPWWCSMGNVDGSHLSIIPNSCSCYDSGQILSNLLSMVSFRPLLNQAEADLQGMATTRHFKKD